MEFTPANLPDQMQSKLNNSKITDTLPHFDAIETKEIVNKIIFFHNKIVKYK